MFELATGVVGRESPVYGGCRLVALVFECGDLSLEGLFVADPPTQALAAEDA